MKVNPKNTLQDVSTILRSPKQKAHATSQDGVDFTQATQLTEKLSASPDVRAEEVARAKALIADPNYPDASIVQAVARKLAGKISP